MLRAAVTMTLCLIASGAARAQQTAAEAAAAARAAQPTAAGASPAAPQAAPAQPAPRENPTAPSATSPTHLGANSNANANLDTNSNLDANVIGAGSPAVAAPGGLASASEKPAHAIELSAYAILNGAWTQSDPQLVTVGRNNGFALGDARIELTGRPADTLWLYLSIDGAAPLKGDDPVAGRRTVELRDAYGVWAPSQHLRIQAGQFKAPQDVEELLEETELKFASRSIVTNGLSAPFGYDAPGLGLDRQLGLGLGTDRVDLGGLGLIAQIALMNGNGANQLLNDTQYPSAVGRVALDLLGRALTIGVDGYFQPRGTGTQPTYFRDNLFGAGADLRYERGPFHAMLLAQVRSTHHVTSHAPDELSLGFSAETAGRFGFVEPALRVSYLDPTSQVATDAITAATLGLNLYAPNAPARLTLDFTHRIEQSGRSLDNDGLELSAQVRF